MAAMVILVTHSVWNPFEATMSAASTLYNDDHGTGDSAAVLQCLGPRRSN